MIRFVLALCALLVLAPVAEAASFDCAKAATSFETAICSTPEASAADDTLAVAYATALGGLSQPAASLVKSTQHAWLDYAARVCSDDGNPIAGTYTDEQTQCLIGAFRERTTALEASRMQGGFRFYPVEQYLVEPDTDPDSNGFNKVATKHFSTVKIDGSDELATAFNAMTEGLRASNADLFAEGTDQLAAGDSTEDIDVTTTVQKVTAYRITLSTTNYSYGHGAAHGNYGISTAHFLIAEKRPLLASDIFAKKGWEKVLGKLLVERTKAQLGDNYFNDSEADIPSWAADPGRWDFSQDGLVIQFQPYEVAAYAAGAVTVTIPWDDLRDLLAENGEAIATY